jgi:hypothetical protein
MNERIQAQLKEFRQDDEARWAYEAQEIARQTRVLNDNGRSDPQFKEELRRAGIDVSALEEQSSRLRELETKAHKELFKVEPPPPRRGRKDAMLLQQVASLAHTRTWLFPPAYEGWGNAEQCGFNLPLGEINTESHKTGDGWGLQAVAYGTEYCTLWFYYFPPESGDLLVQPHVDFQGSVAISAHDHWYTSTHAEILIKLHYDLYQHYWDGEETATIVNEHRHDSSTAYWVDNHRVVSKSLSVSANDIVWIKLTVSKFVMAHSSHAYADCDFRSDANRRIRVEHVWLNLS